MSLQTRMSLFLLWTLKEYSLGEKYFCPYGECQWVLMLFWTPLTFTVEIFFKIRSKKENHAGFKRHEGE